MVKARAEWTCGWLMGVMLLGVAASISGCGAVGSSPSNPTQPISIAITTAPPATLAASGTAMISATVSNDSANAGVDWSCAPAGSCGSFSPAHTASGASTTYTAPAAAGSVTITATSTSSHSATATAIISITAASAKVTISLTTPPPATLALGGTATVSATVSNDSTNAGVDWTCTPSGTCGSFNPAHTASGANTTYTAPGAAVAAVLTATATADTTATVSANVSVTAATPTNFPAGTYSFYLSGENSKKDTYGIAGAVVFDGNGNVTGGEQDYVSDGGATSPEPSPDSITSGNLTVAANGLGTLTLVTNNSAVGVSGTETLGLVMVNSKHAVIAEFDASASSSGSLDLQTLASATLAELNGPFVFVVSGKNGSKAEAFGGLFSANGTGTLSITDLDSNEGGTINRGGTNTGSYTAPDATGRGTMAFGGNHFVYYVVTAGVLRVVVVDTGEPDVGSAYTGVTGVSNSTLNTTFVFTDASGFSSTAEYAAAGTLTMDGNGNVTKGFADVDENGTATSAAVTGTYSVNGSGYGTITIAPGATQDISVLGLYLANPAINPTDPNSPSDAGLFGLLMDLDTKLTGSGLLILPASGTPTFSGGYALSGQSSNSGNEADAVGTVTVAGTSLTGVVDLNDLFDTGQNTAVAVAGTLVPDTANPGRYTISLAETYGTTPPTLKYVIYQASSSQLFFVEVDSPQFALGTLQLQ